MIVHVTRAVLTSARRVRERREQRTSCRRVRSKLSIALSIGTLALLGSLVVGPAAPAGPERMSAGTVVFIHEQEPPSLRGGWLDNNLLATGLVTNNIWYGGQIYDNKAKLQLRLFESKPKLVKTSPQTVTFEYKDSAVWSDGKPVTCEDWKATWRVFVNPQFNVVSRAGWQDIKSVTCNGKAGTVVFRTPFAAWETLVSGGVYAAHAIRGKNMNQMFNNSIPVSSGPWKFQSWQKGVQLTLVKNPRFKAGPPMKLDRVVFRYILDTNARFQAMKAGEGQIMEPQPQLQIADFLNDRNFEVQTSPEYAFEHVDIQLGNRGHPALRLPYVRQALITGINRKQIATALYRTIAPGLPTLENLVFKPFEKAQYQRHFSKWGYNPAKVISILRGKGCTGGPTVPSPSNTDIFTCPNAGRLSFRFFTTTGNQLRAQTFEIVQRDLKSVGIELIPRFQTAGVLFGSTLPSSDWDLMMFTYGGGPDSKITSNTLYSCPSQRGDQNYGNYCNGKATALFNAASRELDPVKRNALLNQGDAQLAIDLPSIPLYVRPKWVISASGLSGPLLNTTSEGTPWNVATWQLK
jgi:peptide/nickel transport system substrate-binding protein